MADNRALRENILDKIVFPTINALISSVIIGAVVSVLIDGKMERWKVISSMQIEREQQARVKTYDAYEATSQAVANFYYRTGMTKEEMYRTIENFGSTIVAQAAYVPPELEDTYTYLDFEYVIGSRLLVREVAKPLSEKELARAGKSHEVAVAAEGMLKDYMRAWQAGEAKKADHILHDYYVKYVEPNYDEANEYSVDLLTAENAVKSKSAIE
jgi:hypothetical protein